MLPSSRGLRWAWAGIFAVALATRLLGLPSTLLSPAEAVQALPALDAARGLGWPAAVESPLLLVGNALLFALLGPGDGAARLLPALAGVLIVMLPLLWRKTLGEVGALSAAALILVSPLALFAARRVDSVAFGTLGAGILFSLALQADGERQMGRRSISMLLAGGVALGVIGGPVFFDLLVPGLVVWAALHWVGSRRPATIAWRPLLVGVGLASLISIAFGLRWDGWAGLTDGLAAWLAGWRVLSDGPAAVGLLALYEPALLLLGFAGLVLLLRRPSAPTLTHWAIVAWSLLVLTVCILRPGGTPSSLSAVVLPIALLGGCAVGWVAGGVPSGSWRWVGLHALVSFGLWIPGVLALTQHASGLAVFDQMALVLLGAGVLIGLQALLIFLFLLPLSADTVWRSALFGTTAIFLVIQASFATNLAYVRSNSPVEIAVDAATSPDLEYLQRTLLDLATRRGVRWDALAVTLLEGDADLTTVLRWQLRDYPRVRVSAIWPDDAQAIVIAPQTATLTGAGASDVWRGMPFTAIASYPGPIPRCEQLVPPRCSSAFKWYFYRTTPYPLTLKSVILWQAGAPD